MASDDLDGARSTATVPPPHAPIVTETKAGPVDQPNRLKRGALGPFEVAASTMADIAPAMSFFFGFGFLAATSGIASPLTIMVAGIAVAFLANTLSRYMQRASVDRLVHHLHRHGLRARPPPSPRPSS